MCCLSVVIQSTIAEGDNDYEEGEKLYERIIYVKGKVEHVVRQNFASKSEDCLYKEKRWVKMGCTSNNK